MKLLVVNVNTLVESKAKKNRAHGRGGAGSFYPSIFLLRLKFDNDVIIKLGRVAHLWNGSSLRSHKWRNGTRFQNKIKMACKTKRRTSLQMGFLSRLYGK